VSLLRRAVFMAAKRAAADPKIQAKAEAFARNELAPRVREAAEWAKPALDRAKREADAMARDLRRVAAKNPPLENPGKFASRAAERLKNRK
jgi:hypothetical protein